MNKMKLAVDVGYHKSGATVAGVLFDSWNDATWTEQFQVHVVDPEPYVPGQFFKRELPCILQLLEEIEVELDTIVVDGFVWLSSGDEPKPGLGAILFEHLNQEVTVVGVAKTDFAGARATKLLRGKSARPLFITAAGVDIVEAIHFVNSMHGPHRIPTLLKYVDKLSREEIDCN